MNEASSSKLSSVSLVALGAILAVVILVPGALAAGRAAQDPATILVKFTVPSQAARAIAAEGDRHLGDTPTHVALIQIDARRTVGEKVAEYAARTDVVYAEPNTSRTLTWRRRTTLRMARSGDSGRFRRFRAGRSTRFLRVVGRGDVGRRRHRRAGEPSRPGESCSNGFGGDVSHGDVRRWAGYGRQRTRYARRRNRRRDDEQWRRRRRNVVLFIDRAGQGPGLNRLRLVCQRRERHFVGSSARRPCDESQPWWAAFSQTLCDAVATATTTYKSLVVAAAGNAGNSTRNYPAACPGAVGVAATDSNDAPATFSSFGSPNVFVSAPGVGILSTYLGSTYRTLSGTSMATPFVTGLAALLVGQNSASTPTSLKQRLAQTSDKVGTGTYGVGSIWDLHRLHLECALRLRAHQRLPRAECGDHGAGLLAQRAHRRAGP